LAPNTKNVMPAKAGIQNNLKILDSRLHGNDQKRFSAAKSDFEIGSNQIHDGVIYE